MGNACSSRSSRPSPTRRGEHPILTAARSPSPTLSGVTVVKEGFGFRLRDPRRASPDIRMPEGGEIINVKREGVSVWSSQVKLDRPTGKWGVPTVLATGGHCCVG